MGLVLPAQAADKPLVFDSAQSHVNVAVHATVDSFTGQLTHFDPIVTVDDAGKVTTARLAFHFRDLETGKAKRNDAMHKWQQSDTFPDGTFVLSSLEPAGTDAFSATGQLTLHGVTREVRFPLTIARQGSVYVIDGDAPLDTRNFGLPIIRMFAVLKVDPVVRVQFHLQGQPQS
ncbi:YceI family protein [Opitutus terrae]|uniref:YceI family protein n=1 Tax=Opitutus terrae TaxID=107709 RepID=UPI00031AEEC3|nr:YceI family protein [Opitutus terrae]